jgi:hypothetical protein
MNTLLRVAVGWIAGGWFGATLLFAFVVAPTAFGVLSGAGTANAMVGPVLRQLHLFGIGAGIVLALLGLALGRAWPLIVGPIVLAAACVFSEFWITAQIAQVLPHHLGPDSSPDMAERFAFLHRLSMVIFGGVGLGAAATFAAHVHADRDGPGRWR